MLLGSLPVPCQLIDVPRGREQRTRGIVMAMVEILEIAMSR